MNRQQPHATGESEKKKLETEEDKLGNHHNDPDHMVNEIWYKNVWRELKKQAKKIANSNTDEDSSPYKSMSIKTHATKKPSDSTRNKLKKNFVSDENLIFPSSEGVKIESWEKVSYSKIVPATDVLSDLRSPKQLKNAAADKRTFDCHGTTRPSDSIGNNFEKLFVSNENLAFRSLKGVEVNHESQKRDKHDKIEPSVQASMILEANCRYRNPPTPADSSRPSIPNQNTGHEENEDTLVHEKDNVDQKEKINVLAEEKRRNVINRWKSIHSEDSLSDFKLLVDIITTSEKTGDKPVEDSLADFKLLVDITTTSEKTVEKLVEVLMWNMLYQNALKTAVADKRSKDVSTGSNAYPNVIRDETYIMMSSIDMVMSEAEHLFGLERSRIFFDLLAAEFCNFGSSGTISEFVPNMAESTVRQNVISFFENACGTMNRLMTLLLRCPDSKILQQMPVQNLIFLMKSVITSSLETKTKGREKLSLEGNIYTMIDPKEFERALEEEIPENVLNRLRSGDEMVVYRFVNTRLERHQPSDGRENRPIHSIYFPSDCRLFIYIPTETGSYWHHLDMQRADRISRHRK